MTALGGVVPSLVTPFDGDGAVDFAALRRIARFAAASGADGVMICGLAGEVAQLDAAERRRCVGAVVDEVGDRLPVFVGIGAGSVRLAQSLARHAEREGAACVVMSVLDGRRRTPRALEDAIAAIAAEVTIPAMVQDAPAYLRTEIGVGVVLQAAQRAPNIRHLKREGGSLSVEQAVSEVGDALALWSGDAGVHLLDSLRSGAVGAMPGVEAVDGLAEVFGHECASRPHEAEERMRDLLPLLVYEMQSLPHYVTCAKHVLRGRGKLGSVTTRMGMDGLGGRPRQLLEGHVRAAGLDSEGTTTRAPVGVPAVGIVTGGEP